MNKAEDAGRAQPRTFENCWDENERLRAQVLILTMAAQERVSHGHNDTCGRMLNSDYECSCGHDALRDALLGETP